MAGFKFGVEDLERLAGAEPGAWDELLDELPVRGASISTMADFLGTETVAASDQQAARIDELQFDLAEGPCWDAIRSGRAVLEPDLRERPLTIWPAFSEAIAVERVGALFAFPLLFGPLRLGALDLYSTEPAQLRKKEIRRTEEITEAVSRAVLNRALLLAGEFEDDETNRFSRRAIHQATGMVVAQLGISADDAQLLIRANAFALGRPMREVADSILERRLSFETRRSGIESSDG